MRAALNSSNSKPTASRWVRAAVWLFAAFIVTGGVSQLSFAGMSAAPTGPGAGIAGDAAMATQTCAPTTISFQTPGGVPTPGCTPSTSPAAGGTPPGPGAPPLPSADRLIEPNTEVTPVSRMSCRDTYQPYKKCGDEPANPRALLPAWRWSNLQLENDISVGLNSIGNILPGVGATVGSIMFSIGALLWRFLLWTVSTVSEINILTAAGAFINRGFAALSRPMLAIGALVWVMVVVRMIGPVMKGNSAGVFRSIVMFALPIGALVTMSVAAGNGTTPDTANATGTPYYYADTFTKQIAQPAEALGSGFNILDPGTTTNDPTTNPLLPNGEEGTSLTPNCVQYVNALRTEYAAAAERPDDAITTQLSRMWEVAVYEPWSLAQFGDRMDRWRTNCRVSEDNAEVPAAEQRALTKASAGGLSNPHPSLFETTAAQRDQGSEGYRERVRMYHWWACTYDDGWKVDTAWYAVSADAWGQTIANADGKTSATNDIKDQVKGRAEPIPSEYCAARWENGYQGEDSVVQVDGKDSAVKLGDVNDGNIEDSTKVDGTDSSHARSLVRNWSGRNAGDRIVYSLMVGLGALSYMYALFGLALGALIAQFGLIILLMLAPVWLVAWAAGSSFGPKMFKMTIGLAASKFVFTLLLTVITQLTAVGIQLVTSSQAVKTSANGVVTQAGIERTILIALIPLIVVFIINKVMTSLGVGKLTSVGGALGAVSNIGSKALGGDDIGQYLKGAGDSAKKAGALAKKAGKGTGAFSDRIKSQKGRKDRLKGMRREIKQLRKDKGDAEGAAAEAKQKHGTDSIEYKDAIRDVGRVQREITKRGRKIDKEKGKLREARLRRAAIAGGGTALALGAVAATGGLAAPAVAALGVAALGAGGASAKATALWGDKRAPSNIERKPGESEPDFEARKAKLRRGAMYRKMLEGGMGIAIGHDRAEDIVLRARESNLYRARQERFDTKLSAPVAEHIRTQGTSDPGGDAAVRQAKAQDLRLDVQRVLSAASNEDEATVMLGNMLQQRVRGLSSATVGNVEGVFVTDDVRAAAVDAERARLAAGGVRNLPEGAVVADLYGNPTIDVTKLGGRAGIAANAEWHDLLHRDEVWLPPELLGRQDGQSVAEAATMWRSYSVAGGRSVIEVDAEGRPQTIAVNAPGVSTDELVRAAKDAVYAADRGYEIRIPDDGHNGKLWASAVAAVTSPISDSRVQETAAKVMHVVEVRDNVSQRAQELGTSLAGIESQVEQLVTRVGNVSGRPDQAVTVPTSLLRSIEQLADRLDNEDFAGVAGEARSVEVTLLNPGAGPEAAVQEGRQRTEEIDTLQQSITDLLDQIEAGTAKVADLKAGVGSIAKLHEALDMSAKAVETAEEQLRGDVAVPGQSGVVRPPRRARI